MRPRTVIWTVGVLLAGLFAGLLSDAGAQPPRRTSATASPRGMLVEEVKNDAPSFFIRVGVDRPDRTYRVGDLMQVTVSSERDGYLYLFYLDAGNKLFCIFPNEYQSSNFIRAGDPSVTIPQPGSGFRFRVGEPTGREILKAVVALEPVKGIKVADLTKAKATPMTTQGLKSIDVELEKISSGAWAEQQIEILTVGGSSGTLPPTDNKPPGGFSGGHKRVGLFIGISDFQDPKIPDLSVGHKDAQGLWSVMRQYGGLTEAQLLLNEQATKAAIEQAICGWLAQTTQPGDTVVLYWSGHGGRCADTEGRHADGQVEYLVPHDGTLANPRSSMVLADTFGRWLQNLDGRRVAIILDACHSGGQAEQGRKGIGGGATKSLPRWGMHFIQNVTRAKDIGHKDMALLASSVASEVSFERKEGDFSVMTYYLLQILQSGGGPVTLPQAYQDLRSKVIQYVEREFPGAEQTPHLVDYCSPPIQLRP